MSTFFQLFTTCELAISLHAASFDFLLIFSLLPAMSRTVLCPRAYDLHLEVLGISIKATLLHFCPTFKLLTVHMALVALELPFFVLLKLQFKVNLELSFSVLLELHFKVS